MARQLVVFVENRLGALSEILHVLAEVELNIQALLLEGSVDFGTARIHVDNPRKAQRALEDAGYQVQLRDALFIRMKNQPGELETVTKKLSKAKINIEALFGTTVTEEGEAEFVLMVSDVEKARKVLGLD